MMLFFWSIILRVKKLNSQRGIKWPDDKIGPDSMTCWVIKKSQGFTDVGLLRISENVRAYVYLILSLQASAWSRIIENTASVLTAQKAFLNNFKNIVNRWADIWEDIKWYQETLSYASSKVDNSMGENSYMLPSDMNLNPIWTGLFANLKRLGGGVAKCPPP